MVRGLKHGLKQDERANPNSLLCLRLLFVCLAVGCLMQTAHDYASLMPGCTPVYYVADGSGSSNLRVQDPDAPFPRDLETTTEELPPVQKMVVAPLYKEEQDRIDHGINDTMRCDRYGAKELPERKKNKRRIFFGSMLANENPEVLVAHAIEVYNKYHVVALVESNTTHNGDPRQMYYGPGSKNSRLLTEAGMFGSPDNTKVVIDYWLEDLPRLKDMNREVEQRSVITKIWIEQGMKESDIGIMADMDEIVSRDFLNALQVCDFEKLRYSPKERPDCQEPKISLSAIQFDGSPLCIKTKSWYHPDVILGNCIEGVGDPSGRVTVQRSVSPPGRKAKTLGQRNDGWGWDDLNDFPTDVIENKRFPLIDGRDIREVHLSNGPLMNYLLKHKKSSQKTAVFGTAYHIHNWFRETNTLRNKFLTYGHSDGNAFKKPLSAYHGGDVNLLVRCARGLGNDIKPDDTWEKKGDPNTHDYFLDNTLLPEGSEEMFTIGGNKPIYFKNRTYVEERHALLQQMIMEDEEEYGTIYSQGSSALEETTE